MKEKYISDSLIILDYDFTMKSKLAIFDLDSTLLKYYENKVQKFEYQYETVPNKLKSIYNDEYSLVIVTNQSTIIINKELNKLKLKIQKFMDNIKIPFLVFICIKKDKYRKPCNGTFKYLIENYKISLFDDVFFVGDAYGFKYVNESNEFESNTKCVDNNKNESYVESSDNIKNNSNFKCEDNQKCKTVQTMQKENINDFKNNSTKSTLHSKQISTYTSTYVSDCDIKYAYNCNIKFYTPEEFFLGKQINPRFDKFDVTTFTGDFKPIKTKYIFIYSLKKYSGVTTFIKKHFNEYTINKDNKLKPYNIYINCDNKNLYDTKDSTYYLFDHSKEIIKWCKGFFYVSGMFYKKSFNVCKKDTLEFLKDKLIKVPFVFDESGFTDEQKEMARMQL